MRLQEGDLVLIDYKENIPNDVPCGFTEEMSVFSGMVAVVKSTWFERENDKKIIYGLNVDLCRFNWTEDMFSHVAHGSNRLVKIIKNPTMY